MLVTLLNAIHPPQFHNVSHTPQCLSDSLMLVRLLQVIFLHVSHILFQNNQANRLIHFYKRFVPLPSGHLTEQHVSCFLVN